MRDRLWRAEDFSAFMSRSGMSAPQAASVLGISEPTVHRLRNGDTSIKDSIAHRAMEYEASTRTTTGLDGEILDSGADTLDLADLCAALPYAHATTVTSVIARGWASLNSNKIRCVCQPVRMPMPERVLDVLLEWITATDLPWGVELRHDTYGRTYRISSIERTIVELLAHEATIGRDLVEEAMLGAFGLSEQQPDLEQISSVIVGRQIEFAGLYERYLRPYAEGLAPDWFRP